MGDKRVAIARGLAGALVGVLVAVAALLVTGWGTSEAEQAPAAPATTAKPQATAAPTTTIVERDLRFESTVLDPRALSVDDGTATFEYEISSLGPELTGVDQELTEYDAFSSETIVPVQPEHWRLVTEIDTYEASTRLGATSVRFDVPDDLTLDQVAEVRLVGWRVVLPLEHVFDIAVVPGEREELPDGGWVEVAFALEQANGTLIKFNADHADDPFASGDVAWHIFTLPGSGWQRGWSDRGFQLSNDDVTEAPPSVGLRYTQSMWVPVEGDVVAWQPAAP